MQEVKIKNNRLGIPIYFESLPRLSDIPDSVINLLMQDLEKEIAICMEDKISRQNQSSNNNEKEDNADSTRPP